MGTDEHASPNIMLFAWCCNFSNNTEYAERGIFWSEQPLIIIGLPLYIEKSKALIESVINLISKTSFDPITFTIPSLLRVELTSIKAQSGIIASFEHIIKTALLSKLFQSKFFTFSLKSFSNREKSYCF